MKIAVKLRSEIISKVVKLVLGTATKSLIVEDAAEADVVITDDPRLMLHALKNAKHVFQLMVDPRSDTLAEGLLTAPAFSGRFKIFVAAREMMREHRELPDFLEMLPALAQIQQAETPADASTEQK